MQQNLARSAILLLLLTGCASGSGVVRITSFDMSVSYDPGMLQYAAGSGTLAVSVRGSPFGASGDDAAPIAAVLPPPGWLSATHFVADSGNPVREYRVVLIFGAGFTEPCDALPTLPKTSAAYGTRVQASFCVGGRAYSSLVADGPPAAAATDPGFRQMMAQVIANLLPPMNNQRLGDSPNRGLGGI